jgi:hypothetical protein
LLPSVEGIYTEISEGEISQISAALHWDSFVSYELFQFPEDCLIFSLFSTVFSAPKIIYSVDSDVNMFISGEQVRI